MVQAKIPALLFLTALVASTGNLHGGVVRARPVVTVRDLVDHELFSRDLANHGLITRDEIEGLFGRELDVELSSFLSERNLERLYAREPDRFLAFFGVIGNFVKSCVHGYWQHMIRKAHLLIGKDDGKDELEFLPRFERDDYGRPHEAHSAPDLFPQPKVAPTSPTATEDFITAWFGTALIRYRNSFLGTIDEGFSGLEGEGGSEMLELAARPAT